MERNKLSDGIGRMSQNVDKLCEKKHVASAARWSQAFYKCEI